MSGPDYVLVGERVAPGPLRTDLADTYRRRVREGFESPVLARRGL